MILYRVNLPGREDTFHVRRDDAHSAAKCLHPRPDVRIERIDITPDRHTMVRLLNDDELPLFPVLERFALTERGGLKPCTWED